MLSPQDLYTYEKEKIVDKVVYLLVQVIHKNISYASVTYKQLVGRQQTIENNLPPLPLSCMSTPHAHTMVPRHTTSWPYNYITGLRLHHRCIKERKSLSKYQQE
jgi:hypothetical protein